MCWFNLVYQGDTAPDNVQPLHLQRVGVSRTNHFQLLPRASKELMQHTKEYERLCVVFEELFEWVGKMVRLIPTLFISFYTYYILGCRTSSRELQKLDDVRRCSSWKRKQPHLSIH